MQSFYVKLVEYGLRNDRVKVKVLWHYGGHEAEWSELSSLLSYDPIPLVRLQSDPSDTHIRARISS